MTIKHHSHRSGARGFRFPAGVFADPGLGSGAGQVVEALARAFLRKGHKEASE